MATSFETIDQLPDARLPYMGNRFYSCIYQPYWGIRDPRANEVFAERLMALGCKTRKGTIQLPL